MAIPQLTNMYPFFAGEIDRLRREGHPDEDILRGITEEIGAVKGFGFTDEDLTRTINLAQFEPPRPGVGERFGAGALESLTLGLVPSELPPAVGFGEAIPEVLGGFAGFAPTAVASELLAVRALAPILRGLAPVARGAVRGAGAGAIATGITGGAEAIRTGEFPSEALAGAPTNIALFALANMLPGIRAARQVAQSTGRPFNEVLRQFTTRTPEAVDLGTLEATNMARLALGLEPHPMPEMAPGAARITDTIAGFEPGGESLLPGRFEPTGPGFVGEAPGRGRGFFEAAEPFGPTAEIGMPLAPEIIAKQAVEAVAPRRARGPRVRIAGEEVFPPTEQISIQRAEAEARFGREAAGATNTLERIDRIAGDAGKVIELTPTESAIVKRAVTPRDHLAVSEKVTLNVKPGKPRTPPLKVFMDAMREAIEADPEIRVTRKGEPVETLVVDEAVGPRKRTKTESQVATQLERNLKRVRSVDPLVDTGEQTQIGILVRDTLGFKASKKSARSATHAEIKNLAEFRENRAVLAELARDPEINQAELTQFARQMNALRDKSILPVADKSRLYGDAEQFVAGIRAQTPTARPGVPGAARTAEDIRRIAEARAGMARQRTVRRAEVTPQEVLRAGPEPRVKTRAVSGRDIFEAIKLNDVTRRATGNLIENLIKEAETQGLTVEAVSVPRPGGEIAFRIKGEAFGAHREATFSDVGQALRALRMDKPFEVPWRFEETILRNPKQVTESYLLQREAERVTGKVVRDQNKTMKCLSPCKDFGEVLTEPERIRLREWATKIPELERQLKATEDLTWLNRIKRGWQDISNRPFLPEFMSPSFNLEKFPTGKQLIQRTDTVYRDMGKYIDRRLEKVYGVMTARGRTGGPYPFKRGSLEDYAVGYLVENPEMASSMPKPIQTAAVAMRGAFEDMIREYGLARPGEKIGRIKNYLPHIFDRETLVETLREEIAAIEKGGSPADRARVVQMRDTLTTLEQGGWPVYEAIPTKLRMRFFEERTGRGGYSFSAVKAHDTYLAVLSRKMHLEPLLKEFETRIGELPVEYRALAKEYLRHATQIKESIPDAMDSLANKVREIQFIRTIGFNPTSAARNAFQAVFAMPEVGPKHWTRGFKANFTPEGQALFEASGHGIDVPHIFLNQRNFMNPTWAKVVDYAGFMFNKVERGNRSVTYLGSLSKWFEENGPRVGMTFQDALRSKAVPEAAARFADDLVRKTQFRYGTVDLPLLLRKPIIGTALQFSSFPIKATELMWKWAVREGNTGRLKLMGLIMAGSGVAATGNLFGYPTLADGTASPVNLSEMFDAMLAMGEGDWAKAKSEMSRVLQPGDFTVRFGPTGSLLQRVVELKQDIDEGRDISNVIQRFALREVSPVPAIKLWQSVQQLEAGGSPRDFVSVALGFPTHDAIVRKQYLTLLELGRNEVASNLLNEYRKARGGTLPIDYSTTRRMQATAKSERKEREKELKKETTSETIRRQFPSSVEDALFNLGRSVL